MGGYQLMQIVLGPSVPIFGHFLPQLFSQSPEYLSLSPRQCIIHTVHPRIVKDEQTTSNASPSCHANRAKTASIPVFPNNLLSDSCSLFGSDNFTSETWGILLIVW